MSKYVASIETSAEGAVRVELQGISTDANGQAIVLRPWVNQNRARAIEPGDAIGVWDCGQDPANAVDISTLVPSSCRSSAAMIGALTAFAASAS